MKRRVKHVATLVIAAVFVMAGGGVDAQDLLFEPSMLEIDGYSELDDRSELYANSESDLQTSETADPKEEPGEAPEQSTRIAALPFPLDVQQRRSEIIDTLGTEEPPGTPAQIRDTAKQYGFTVLLATEYDSNVQLTRAQGGAGLLADSEDSRFLVATFLDYQAIATYEWSVGMVASTYNTFQFDATEFDLQNYMGGAYVNRRLWEDWIASVRYEFLYTLIDRQWLASDHRLLNSLSRIDSAGHITAYYEYNPLESRAVALLPAQDQSGDSHRVGVTRALQSTLTAGWIYVGYRFGVTIADGSDFDRNSHRPRIRYEQALPWQCFADVDVSYTLDDYDNPNSLDVTGQARKDRRIELRTGIQKNFSPRRFPLDGLMSLRLDYTFIDNDSNTTDVVGVRPYDYDRHLLSSQVIISF